MTQSKQTATEHLAQLQDEYRRRNAEQTLCGGDETLDELREAIEQAKIEVAYEH